MASLNIHPEDREGHEIRTIHQNQHGSMTPSWLLFSQVVLGMPMIDLIIYLCVPVIVWLLSFLSKAIDGDVTADPVVIQFMAAGEADIPPREPSNLNTPGPSAATNIIDITRTTMAQEIQQDAQGSDLRVHVEGKDGVEVILNPKPVRVYTQQYPLGPEGRE